MHALVIEDEPLIAAVVEDYLIELGYTVDVIDTEQGAIEAAANRCPDLIIADDQITEGSGIAAVDVICADQVIPVIYSVGLADARYKDRLLPYGAVLQKPYTLGTFVEAMNQAVAKAALRSEP